MTRLNGLSGVVVLYATAVSVLSAQSPRVTANNEPHHKRLLYTNDIRVFDVTIPAGDSAADHVHDYDMAAVVIGDGTARISRNGEEVSAPVTDRQGSVIISEQSGAPAIYRIQNTGNVDYHVIEVENIREGGGWLTPTLMTAPGTAVSKQSRAFTVYDVQLKAGTAPSMHAHTWSTFLILLDGSMENGGIGGEVPVHLQRFGQWLTFPRAQNHTVAALGGDAHFIEIEAR